MTHAWSIQRKGWAGTRNGCPLWTIPITRKEFAWRFAGESSRSWNFNPQSILTCRSVHPCPFLVTSIGRARCPRYSRTASRPSASKSTSTDRCWPCTRTANCEESISVCPPVASALSPRCKQPPSWVRPPRTEHEHQSRQEDSCVAGCGWLVRWMDGWIEMVHADRV